MPLIHDAVQEHASDKCTLRGRDPENNSPASAKNAEPAAISCGYRRIYEQEIKVDTGTHSSRP